MAPGDEIKFKDKGILNIEVKWTTTKETTGRIELVENGKVIAVKEGTSKPGAPLVLSVQRPVDKSSWICARRMTGAEHASHAAAVYVTVNNKPVRASAEDARFFVSWIDNVLKKHNNFGKMEPVLYARPRCGKSPLYKGTGYLQQYCSGSLKTMITSMKQRHKIFLLLTGIATICFSGSIQAAGKADAPILILGTQDHFAGYTGEILKAEGFNEFRLQPVTAVDFSLEYLKRFDIIILTAISLTGQQENGLLAYVKAGGNLIAFRPGNRLTSVLVSQVQPARLIQGIYRH